MAEEILNNSFADFNELESKIGRKTPESLLIWMRDAAECKEDGWRSDVLDRENHNSAFCDSLSDKLSNLKQEMRWLRAADVRILRQLVAVHEGIETMRWLMEDRATVTSRGSSLTGSLSSLVTVEEHGPSMSPCSESPSPAFHQDLNETTSEKPEDQRTPCTDCDSSRFETLTSDSSKARPPNPSTSKLIAGHSPHESHGQEQVSPSSSLLSANDLRPEKQDSNAACLQNIKSGAQTIRRALQRSSKRRPIKMDSGHLAPGRESAEKRTAQPTQESLPASQSNTADKKETSPAEETVLLGYDAQWRWVESQDDVTFL